MTFASETIQTWDNLTKRIKNLLVVCDKWVYRGHEQDYELATTLERAQKYFDIDSSDMLDIEHQLIRNFRRRFQDERDDNLNKDTLYCISLMQHYGSPTRLLDFTWSPFIGILFALHGSKNPPYKREEMPVLWCINVDWINLRVSKLINHKLLRERWSDEHRNDKSFIPMYMSKRRNKFVDLENPLRLNNRLVVQQGTFLCPGDIYCSFEDNLKNLTGWNKKDNILKIFLDFSKKKEKFLCKN